MSQWPIDEIDEWQRSKHAHHTLLAANDAEIAKLRTERDAAWADARQLRLEKAESALCDFHEPDETDCEDCQEVRTEARRALGREGT